MVNFYEKAIKLVGELPVTANWIYLITAVMLFLFVVIILVLPIVTIFKKVGV